MNTPGENDKDVSLDTADENRSAIISLAQQARFSLNIFSRDLDARVFDNIELERCIFNLARSHKNADIRILVTDTTRAVNQGHCLIRLAQKLTSKVLVHNPAREHSNEISTFLIADEVGLLHRPRTSSNNYDAIVNYDAPLRARELRDYFNEMWERSTPDSQIRRLYI